MSGAYDARDRLLANLKTWNARSEALRVSGKADPSWDANAGSGMLQERQERYAASPGFSEDARVSQILGLLFAGNGLTPPVSFWYLFETLKDPSVFRRITEELRSSFDAQKDTYDFMTLTQQPFLQSLHAETTRMYSSNVAQRVVTTPTFALSDKYTVTQGTTLFIYTKPTALFTPGWTEARAESTTKPLDTFWAERFLVGGDTKRERYSHAGLSGCWTSFGGGEHKCPGRHFARNVGIGALAVLLGHYECELVDNEGKINVRPNIRETAFGKMQPTKKVEARLRRRQR
jgi:cytochrome P450